MSLSNDYKEILESSRKAVEVYGVTMAKLEGIGSMPWGRIHTTPGAISDPASSWLKNLDKATECVEQIRQGRAIVNEVAQSLSVRHAEPLRLYYLEAVPTWEEVANRSHISKRYVLMLKREAFAWLENGNSTAQEPSPGAPRLTLTQVPERS